MKMELSALAKVLGGKKVLRSAVVEHELNILINPLHPDMKHVSIFQVARYTVDKRLLR
jgi:hypothetical protein